MASLLSYALTNLSDVKESLGIASSDLSWDNLIIRNINKATRAIENYCGRRFKETSYTQEEYDATLTDEIVLRQRPVTSTTTFLLEVRDTALNDNSWETVQSELYFVDNNSGVVRLLFNANGHWARYRFTYSAGYPTIPEDIAEACADLAGYYTVNSGAEGIGVQEKVEGQRRIRYANASLNFQTIIENLGIDQIIEAYSNYPVMSDR